MFQDEMTVLLRELKARGALDPDDQDIATQLCRVLQEHPEIPEARVLSEIGILFVEGFETTGACCCCPQVLPRAALRPRALRPLPHAPHPPPPILHSGHTTSWTLFNIATSPGVQEKIAEELDSLGLLAKPECPQPRELEWDDLKKLPYLIAATKEAMRMLPVVSVMGRVAGMDVTGKPVARTHPWAAMWCAEPC
jgi:cytochrome P450